ncbi:MAG: exodeoxyribonuclease V subunit alpha [Verrucomicrobia bacterium]|nr:exodeoxyribonuclease V subunit alpha [Verrucomicrobiota bacterium]
MNGLLEQLRESGVLNGLDLRFADLVVRRGGPGASALAVPAALVSALRRRGHVCMDLARPPAAWFAASFGADAPDAPEFSKGWKLAAGRFPTLGRPGDRAPLILDGTRLYLHRLWTCQHDLASRLAGRASAPPVPIPAAVSKALAGAFRGAAQAGQLAAARAVASRSLSVISGGPGTGKTTAAVRALGALRAGGPVRIALAAPTGKAVARLKESLAAAEVPADEVVAATLHRLLRVNPSTGRPAHDPANPLPYDLVIADEVSMVDLELMAALVRALAPETRLVLLGDRDQLASVEPGSVFSDICAGLECGRSSSPAGLAPADPEISASRNARSRGGGRDRETAPSEIVTVLRHNFRFGADSGIGRLAQAVNAGDASAASKLLGGGLPDVAMRAPPSSRELGLAVRTRAKASWHALLDADTPEAALAALPAFRFLCAHRVGPWGSVRISSELGSLRGGLRGSGSPVIVTANDAATGLYNGDTGVWWTGETGLTGVFVGEGGLRRLSVGRMPPNEAAWALTVHKSQGSEFDEVVLVLPDRDSPLLTRELIYTAITRARRHLEIWGAPEILAAALARRIDRAGGLPEALAAAAAEGRRARGK